MVGQEVGGRVDRVSRDFGSVSNVVRHPVGSHRIQPGACQLARAFDGEFTDLTEQTGRSAQPRRGDIHHVSKSVGHPAHSAPQPTRDRMIGFLQPVVVGATDFRKLVRILTKDRFGLAFDGLGQGRVAECQRLQVAGDSLLSRLQVGVAAAPLQMLVEASLDSIPGQTFQVFLRPDRGIVVSILPVLRYLLPGDILVQEIVVGLAFGKVF